MHPDLFINNRAVKDESELEKLFSLTNFSCQVNDYSLEVEFSKDGSAFIGWLNLDEEIFYYNNGSENHAPVNLCINVCPEERMMCYDVGIIRDIVMHFCETGMRNPKYQWIEDTF